MNSEVSGDVHIGKRLWRYGFPEGHPFGPWRPRDFCEAMAVKGPLMSG